MIGVCVCVCPSWWMGRVIMLTCITYVPIIYPYVRMAKRVKWLKAGWVVGCEGGEGGRKLKILKAYH